MSIRVVAFSAVLFASTALAAAPLAPADSTARARIDRAHAEGRIDDATHALLGFRLARAPKTLPDEFRPAADDAPIRCGTLLARRAFLMAKAGAFDDAQTAEFAALGGRPDFPNYINVIDGDLNDIGVVHYPAGVTLEEAEAIANFLVESWEAEFGTMGWRQPPSDGGGDPNPDDPNPDIYLDLYLDPGTDGAVTIPTIDGPENWDDAASYIILDPNVPNVQTYVAHELNHSSQFAYDYTDGDFIYEATATWMEDRVYDSVNDYTFFIGDFQSNPSQTLSFATYASSYMYGGAVFVHYLADLYDAGGTTLVRDVWDAMKAGNTDWYDGVASELAAEGFTDFADVYTEFAGYRLLTGLRDDGSIDEGNEMSAVAVHAAFDYSSMDSGTTTDPPRGMGSNYITVTSSGAEEGDALTLFVESDEPGPWSITAITIPATGSATVTVFPDDDGDGKVEAKISDVMLYSEIGFAVTNAANLADGADSSFGPNGHSVDLTSHPFSWSFSKENEAVGCGCQIPAGRRAPSALSVIAAFLAVAGSIVLRRRS